MTLDAPEAAGFATQEILPARWRVGPVTYRPRVVRADGPMGAFSSTARGPHPGRGKASQKTNNELGRVLERSPG